MRPARLSTAGALLLVMLVAGFNLFHGLGRPAQPIWDESYYLTAAARSERGIAQFASHPPLGFLLIAAGDRLSGLNAAIDRRGMAAVKSIPGKAMPAGFDYRGPRLAAAAFGTLGAGLFFLLMVELIGSRTAALGFSSLYVFDNALIAQFRAAQLDAFQIAFVLLALLAALRVLRTDRAAWRPALLFGVACGLATMVRANAVMLLAAVPLLMLSRAARAGANSVLPQRDCCGIGAASGAGFALAIALVMAAHVAIGRAAPQATPAGQIDARFVSPRYADYLAGKRRLSPLVVADAANDYRRFMAGDLAGMPQSDPNGSPAWLWPFGRRPITVRWDVEHAQASYLVLVANPAGWAAGLGGLIGALGLLAGGRRAAMRIGRPELEATALLAGLWVALMALHAWLGLSRVMYLYHYFIPLILSFGLSALFYRRLVAGGGAPALWAERIARGGGGLVLGCFLFYAPLTLHRPLGHAACALRNVPLPVVQCRT